jgi:hypothetical protein
MHIPTQESELRHKKKKQTAKPTSSHSAYEKQGEVFGSMMNESPMGNYNLITE